MICPKCSKTIPEQSLYCNYCGKKLSVQKRKTVKSRGNGQGTAIRRGKTWTAISTIDWVFPSDPSKPKRPIRRSKGGFTTKADALAYCPTLKAGGIEKPAEAPRLSHYWKVYSEGDMLQISKGKQSAYRTAWNKLKQIHDVRVDAITVDLLRKVVSDSCKTFDPAKDCKSLLSNLFELASADRFAVRELPSYIILPEHEEKERIPFTKEEQVALWKAYDNGDLRAAIPLLMIATGLMPGEMQLLKAENIDIKNRVIIRSGLKTKIRKRTPVVLSDAILPVVQDLIDHAQQSGYLWKRVEKDWYDAYYAVLEAAGCRRLTPYSCRHTCASNLSIDKNIPPQTVRRVMRWSTERMLDRYAHASMEDALNAVNTVERPTADKSEQDE